MRRALLTFLAIAPAVCVCPAAGSGGLAPTAANGLIAFASDRAENLHDAQVYVLGAGGSRRASVSRGSARGEDPHPTWSPDGSRLAFSGADGLVIVRVGGGGERRLAGPSGSPAWSPNGDEIAAVREGQGIWLVRVRDGRIRRLTRGYGGPPVWSPSGGRIAFLRATELGYALFVVDARRGRLARVAQSVTEDAYPTRYTWSPNGRQIAFERDDDVWVVDVRTRKQRNVTRTRGAAESGPAWSPRGTEIAFVRRHGRHADVYSVAPTGGRARRLTRGRGLARSLAWSPRGSHLAFVRADAVHLIARNGRPVGRLTRRRCGEQVTALTWAPRGRRLAFSSFLPSNDLEIFAVQPDGRRLSRLTANCAADDRSPAWSPNGREIAYERRAGVASQLYRMSADGSKKVNISRNRSFETEPSWSPDGATLAFVTGTRASGEIALMRRDGRGRKQLTSTVGANVSPAWSPAGRRIAFVSTRDGNREIYVMGADGSNQARLTENPTADADPAWSPDGSQLVFVREHGLSSDLWAVSADGGAARPLTRNRPYARVSQSTWSPDERWIFFSADLDGDKDDDPQLAVVASDGSDLTGLVYQWRARHLDPDWQRRQPGSARRR